MNLDGCMAEIRSMISRVTWPRSGAGRARRRHRTHRLRDRRGVVVSDVSNAKREALVEFGKKNMEETAQDGALDKLQEARQSHLLLAQILLCDKVGDPH